jgi:hypothetical protein
MIDDKEIIAASMTVGSCVAMTNLQPRCRISRMFSNRAAVRSEALASEVRYLWAYYSDQLRSWTLTLHTSSKTTSLPGKESVRSKKSSMTILNREQAVVLSRCGFDLLFRIRDVHAIEQRLQVDENKLSWLEVRTEAPVRVALQNKRLQNVESLLQHLLLSCI